MIIASKIKPISEQVRQATLRAYEESFGHGPRASATAQQMIEHLQRLGYRVVAPDTEASKAA